MLLETLCNANGVSGNEDEVREIIINEIKPYADKITIDTLGNLIAFKKGKSSEKKVMLSAHMDEVGFIISKITDEGYLKFKTVGGIDTRVILGKKVTVANRVKGIIGVKAVHLLSESEKGTIPKVSDIYIDIGATSKEEAEKYVSIGDYAVFDTKFEKLGGNRIKAKAIDDRAGCYIISKILREEPVFDLYVCFTAQEEVGLRGAGVCAKRIKPDMALVVESTTCADVYKTPKSEMVTELGKGAVLSFMDRTTIVNKSYLDRLTEFAKTNNISWQYKNMTSGGNDAGSIHLSSGGILTASVSVPCRYIHSPACIADTFDIESAFAFVRAYLKNIGGILS